MASFLDQAGAWRSSQNEQAGAEEGPGAGAPMAELPCPAAISTQCPDPPRILCLRCRWSTMASRLGAWSRRGPLRPRPGPGAATGQTECVLETGKFAEMATGLQGIRAGPPGHGRGAGGQQRGGPAGGRPGILRQEASLGGQGKHTPVEGGAGSTGPPSAARGPRACLPQCSSRAPESPGRMLGTDPQHPAWDFIWEQGGYRSVKEDGLALAAEGWGGPNGV